MLDKWRRKYEQEMGRPVQGSDPVLCANVRGFYVNGVKPAPAVDWGTPLGFTAMWDLVLRRAEQSGLGHVTPHDLRRATATILHNAKTTDGAHLYDLLDIQRVMDHADPATTQRSYIDHLDTTVKQRAGNDLD
jgi:integrase